MKKILALVCMMAVALTFSMGSIGCGDKGTTTGTAKGSTVKDTKETKTSGDTVKDTKEAPK